MTTGSQEDNATIANAVAKLRHSEALVQKARHAILASRIFLVIAALLLVMASISLFNEKPVSLGPENLRSPEQLRAEALVESGKGIAKFAISLTGTVCFLLAIRFARKWARAASESMQTSAAENDRVLQAARSSGVPIALYLRGFEEEGRSFQSVFAVPFLAKRPDKLTRWVESEIIDEFKRRNIRVFCIANPSDAYLLPGAIRLCAQPEAWYSEVSILANESAVIVIYVSSVTKGLIMELDLLRNQNLINKSVVIARKKVYRQHILPKGHFPIMIAPPPFPKFNQSAFGPIVGRQRFRREFSSSIGKIIHS